MTRPIATLPLLLLAVGCAPPNWYQAPRPDLPHATVDLTIRYRSRPGPELRQLVQLNRRLLREPGAGNVVIGEGTRRLDIWAMDGWFDFRSAFYQTITRREPRTFMRTQRYVCGTYGRPGATRWCTRTVAETQWVMTTQRVRVGACAARVSLSPHVGEHFTVEYDFIGPGACEARCTQQVMTSQGPQQVLCAPAINPPPPLGDEEDG